MFGGQHCGGCLEGSIVTDVWRVAALWRMFGKIRGAATGRLF